MNTEAEAAAVQRAKTAADKAHKLAEAHAEAANVRANLQRGDMQSIEKMKAAPVIAAANLILSPAAQITTKAAALEALRPLCASPASSAPMDVSSILS
jgi:hypothetical protein